MIYSRKYCQGDFINLRQCPPMPHCPPPCNSCPTWANICPTCQPRECPTCCPPRCCNDDLTMFLIGYMIGQKNRR